MAPQAMTGESSGGSGMLGLRCEQHDRALADHEQRLRTLEERDLTLLGDFKALRWQVFAAAAVASAAGSGLLGLLRATVAP